MSIGRWRKLSYLDALMLMVALCNCAVVLFILCVSSFISFYFCTSYPLLLYVQALKRVSPPHVGSGAL